MNRFPLLSDFLSNPIHSRSTTEDKLRTWAKSPSQTEIEKCERAVRMIKRAIDSDPRLSTLDISVYAKGSYHNRTNIPSDSDVDVAVVANEYFCNTYPSGTYNENFGFVSTSYSYGQFKADVARAISNEFGTPEVTVSSKCIKVSSNSCRVDADVVPHYVHRRYAADGSFHEGVAIRDSKGATIYNWPEQDYDNAISKNESTGKRYKAFVRILKSIKSEMHESGYTSAPNVPSYLIACLAWNVPDHFFFEESYMKMSLAAISYLIDMTSNVPSVTEWGEVNELKYLFRNSQPWQLQEVNQFLRDAKQFLVGL